MKNIHFTEHEQSWEEGKAILWSIWWINTVIKYLFNRDLNRGCLVYMFSLRFSVSKSLINLRYGNFVYVKLFHKSNFINDGSFAYVKFFHNSNFMHKFLRDFHSFYVCKVPRRKFQSQSALQFLPSKINLFACQILLV